MRMFFKKAKGKRHLHVDVIKAESAPDQLRHVLAKTRVTKERAERFLSQFLDAKVSVGVTAHYEAPTAELEPKSLIRWLVPKQMTQQHNWTMRALGYEFIADDLPLKFSFLEFDGLLGADIETHYDATIDSAYLRDALDICDTAFDSLFRKAHEEALHAQIT